MRANEMLRGIMLSLATVAASLAVVALVVTAPKSVTAADLPPRTPDLANGRTSTFLRQHLS